MMIDISAAFDMVDHPLLLEKLKLFGLEEEVIQWFDSYFSGRTQSVMTDGSLSPPLSATGSQASRWCCTSLSSWHTRLLQLDPLSTWQQRCLQLILGRHGRQQQGA